MQSIYEVDGRMKERYVERCILTTNNLNNKNHDEEVLISICSRVNGN